MLPEIKPEVKPEETVPAKRSLSGVEFSFYSKDCVVNASLKNRLTLKRDCRERYFCRMGDVIA